MSNGNPIYRIFIVATVAGLMAFFVSGLIFGASNALFTILGIGDQVRLMASVCTAAFLPWYMVFHETNRRPSNHSTNFEKTIRDTENTVVLDDETDWKLKKLSWENTVLKAELEKLKGNE